MPTPVPSADRGGARRAPRRSLAAALVLWFAAVESAAGPASDASVLADVGKPVAERLDAARALAAAPQGPQRDEAVGALLGVLDDRSAEVRVLAVQALSSMGDARALPRLVRRLPAESDPRAVAAVVLAVGHLGGKAEVGTIWPYAAHEDARLRAAAAIALGEAGGELAHERLLDLLASPGDDPEWAVRGSVMLGLARCGVKADAGTILVAYREGQGSQRWFARAALSTAMAVLDSDPVPLLDRLAADDDARVSSAAVAAFAKAGRPEEVVRRLADERPGVRAAAAAAVGQAELRDALPRLRAMAREDRDRAVRLSAAFALSRLNDPAGDELLVEAVGADDPGVWTLALAELRRRTGLSIGRDPAAWKAALAERRAQGR